MNHREAIAHTQRLRLEKIDRFYRASLIDLLTNKHVHRYFPHTPDEEEALAFYERIQTGYAEDQFSYWAVIREEDDQFLGICGLLKQIIRGVSEVEVGYRLLDQFWGQGYATEAAQACLDYANDQLNLPSVIALIRPENIPSSKVALRLGMKPEGNVIFHQLPHDVYRVILA